MNTASKKLMLVGALAGLTLAAFIAGSVAAAAGQVSVQRPETISGTVPIVPPLAPPAGAAQYAVHAIGQRVVHPDGRTIAQLAPAPSWLSELASWTPQQRQASPGDIAYQFLSTVRYSGNGHTVVVSTVRPSTAAAAAQTLLGDHTVELADGSAAWVKEGLPGALPTRVATIRAGLIVAVAGDLPLAELVKLSGQVVTP